MKKFLLFLNTLRYLKWQQIYFRLVRKLFKLKVTDTFEGPKPQRSISWQHHALFDSKIDAKLEACFLNHSKEFNCT